MLKVEFLQQRQLLFSKRSFNVVFFLVLDVADHRAQLGMRIRERPEALLPGEPAW